MASVEFTATLLKNKKEWLGTDTSHGENLLKFLYDCYKKNIYCDITVKVEERCFRTHKFVLAMLSEYLCAMLQRHMNENDCDYIMLDGMITADIFEAILTFAYTATLNLSEIDVESLAVSSDYLGISSLKNMCEIFMSKEICNENCFSFLQFADTYTMKELYENAKVFLCRDFDNMISRKDFLQLPVSVLVNFLTDENIILYKKKTYETPLHNIEREKALFKCVLRFAENQSDNSCVLELFKVLKFLLLPEEYIKKHMNKHKGLLKNRDVTELLELIHLYKMKEFTEEQLPPFWLTPRKFPIYKYLSTPCYGNYSGQYGPMRSKQWFGPAFEDEAMDETGNPDCIIDPYAFITKLICTFRSWDGRCVLGRVQVFYNDGSIIDSGMLNKPAMLEKELSLHKDEHVINYKICSGWLIDQLEFKTNTGKIFGPYGGDGGGGRNMKIPIGYQLHAISGCVAETDGDIAVIRLFLHFIKYE